MHKTFCRVLLFCLFVFVFATFFISEEASAIPSFARKYATSCQTCHIVFPKLTAFGEAFRRNGYRFPGGADEDYSKDKPLKLGAEGYKKVFPNAVWPTDIPGTPQISAMVESAYKNTPQGARKHSFDDFAGEFEILTAGTIGEDMAYYGEIAITEAIEIERAYGIAQVPLPGLSLVKIGKFEPGVLSLSNHRRITPKYWITTKTLGGNAWALEGEQKGIELFGVTQQGRLGYNVGVVEGRKNAANNAKDFYGHITYKFDGMRLDGAEEGGAEKALENPRPWVDDSITVGLFGYLGKAAIASGTATQNDNFSVIGGDINWFKENLNLILGLSTQNDSAPTFGSAASDSASQWFLEADYVVFPWLVPALRFESYKKGSAAVDTSRILAAINILYRANILGMIHLEFEREEAEYKIMEIEAGLKVAI